MTGIVDEACKQVRVHKYYVIKSKTNAEECKDALGVVNADDDPDMGENM